MEEMVVEIGSDIVQVVEGKVEKKEIKVNLTEDFIKHINEISNSKIIFIKQRDNSVSIDYASIDFIKARDVLRDIIKEYVTQCYKNNAKIDEITIDKDTLDLTKFIETVNNTFDSLSKKKMLEEKRQKIREQIEKICEEKTNDTFKFECFECSSYAEVKVCVRGRDGILRKLDEFRLNYNDDAIEKLKKYDAYKEYLLKITDEKEKLQEKLRTIEQKYNVLVEFIKENDLVTEFRDYLIEQEKKSLEEELIENIESKFAEILETDEDYDC